MKIMFLYNNDCALRLFNWLTKEGHDCVLWSDEIDIDWVKQQKFELAISYTYSRLIKKEVIEALDFNIVNLHTSYLPFNRGVDPNMWSLIDGTPRGVTLHYIDERLDRGFVISQTLINNPNLEDATLKSTYQELDDAAFELFKNSFKNYKYWNEMKKTVLGKGTYHTDRQGVELRNYVTSFDMRVEDFLNRYNSNK